MTMAKKKQILSLAPQGQSDTWWYYEEAKGIHLVSYKPADKVTPSHITIPWSLLEKTLQRYQRHKRAAKGKEGGQ
jgi:hypothetical protein